MFYEDSKLTEILSLSYLNCENARNCMRPVECKFDMLASRDTTMQIIDF